MYTITYAPQQCCGIKICALTHDGTLTGRAYLYILRNDLHADPFGLLEDVFVDERARNAGIGAHVIKTAIHLAHERGCYKLIATSRTHRPRVHALYKKLGFSEHGTEFRIDLVSDERN